MSDVEHLDDPYGDRLCYQRLAHRELSETIQSAGGRMCAACLTDN